MSDKLTKAALEELHAFQMARADCAEERVADLEGQLERLQKRFDEAQASEIEVRQAHLILDAIPEAPSRICDMAYTRSQRTVSQRVVGLALALVRRPEPPTEPLALPFQP